MKQIGHRCHENNFRIRIILLKAPHKFVKITVKSSLFTVIHTSYHIFMQTETIVGTTHNDNHIRIFRNILISFAECLIPVSSVRRTSDTVVRYLCSQ